MTNNTDEFDQDQFDSLDELEEQEKRNVKQSVMEAWRNNPLFKLVVIMAFVGIALAGALGAFSGSPPIEAAQITNASRINEAPGGQSTPFFIEQNKQANEQRVQQALREGHSAIPTPHGTNIDLSDLTDKDRKDPLLEFRAETERMKQELRAEQKQAAQQIQMMQQQIQRPPEQPEDDSLAKAMQKQMQELMESWKPRSMISVKGFEPPKEETASSLVQMPASTQAAEITPTMSGPTEKILVPAGSVNYAQLLTEANSDVPGPILLQILSGPLAGGRAIGQFQVMNDYLILTFNLVSLKGKEYSINALALNPDTTLGGLATEVDHRYFSRVLLPAAGAFVQAFGSALGSGSSEAVVSGDSVIVTQAQKGYKEATYAGLGQVGETLSQFFQNEANQIKPLVRVAVGTPMGLFFLQSVKDSPNQGQSGPMGFTEQARLQELLAQGYQQGSARNAGPYGSTGSSYPGVQTGPSAYGSSSSYRSGVNPYGSMSGYSGVSPYASPQSMTMGNTTIYTGR